VKLLLDHGADVNVGHRPLFRTALMHAAFRGCKPSVTLLLDQGADVGHEDIDGKAALVIAAENGQVEVLDLLLAKYVGEAAEKSGLSAKLFCAAAWYGKTGTIEHLVRRGFDIESKDADGQTALALVAGGGNQKAVAELLQAGADIDAEDRYRNTALSAAVRWGNKKVVEVLLQRGANIEARDRSGSTPLITACYFGRETIAKWLVEEGAKVGAKDACGQTALIHAAANGLSSVVY